MDLIAAVEPVQSIRERDQKLSAQCIADMRTVELQDGHSPGMRFQQFMCFW